MAVALRRTPLDNCQASCPIKICELGCPHDRAKSGASLTSDLLQRTMTLLKARPRELTYPVIAEAIGVSAKWLEALIAGKIEDPGVNKIERLYNLLAARTDV